MTCTIIEASPEAKKRITEEAKINKELEEISGIVKASEHHRIKYPFEALKIGQCFTVPIAEASDTTLRVTASNKGKKLNRKFCVLKHKEFACIEVARIA